LFKGLGQSIQTLSQDQVEIQHRDTVKRIKNLGLANVGSEEEDIVEESADIAVKEKSEMINNVIEELKDFGEIDE
jgi:hypothetical protein